MDCKLVNEKVLVNECLFEGSTEQPIDIDISLPDYCADIGKILKCRAVPRVTERLVKPDSLNIAGMTRLAILYADGRSGEVNCYEHEIPFAASIPLTDAPHDAKASVCVRMEYVNCRALSQRKLDIHGAFSIKAKVTCKREASLASDVEGDGIRLRKKMCKAGNLVSDTQSSFIISEALEVAKDKASIGSIIRNDAVLSVNEQKIIGGKLVIKGDAILTIVYIGEAGEGIEKMEYLMPYNQFIDVDGIEDDCKCDIKLECENIDIGLRTDPDGEYRRMNADIKAFVEAKVYTELETPFVYDAYSVDYETEVERKQLNIEQLSDTVSENIMHQQLLDTGVDIASVLDIWGDTRDCKVGRKDDKLTLWAAVSVGMILKNSEGGISYIEKLCELEQDIGVLDTSKQFYADAQLVVRNCNYTLSGSNGVDVRLQMQLNAAIYEQQNISSVGAITLDENKPKNLSDAAVVLYFAHAGEELWDIARKHNSSIETIMADNELASEQLDDSRMLLIAI
ncbi:MAG: DUF3794 domain-containing protein [Oscillospiraceae bacterium]|jgi:hypothetical protein|nr:DUF3794 domain-containing protein [Oscillospiraceae bacterium]